MTLLVGIIEACAAGKKINRTQVYKAFYLAHLINVLERGAILSDWPIVHMDRGPGPNDARELLSDLAAMGVIRETRATSGPFLEYQYSIRSHEEAREMLKGLRPGERKSIQEACKIASSKSGAALSQLTHRYSRAWKRADKQGRRGGELAIYADIISDDEESDDLQERLKDAELHLRDVF